MRFANIMTGHAMYVELAIQGSGRQHLMVSMIQ
jgi:hypothetical protein